MNFPALLFTTSNPSLHGSVRGGWFHQKVVDRQHTFAIKDASCEQPQGSRQHDCYQVLWLRQGAVDKLRYAALLVWLVGVRSCAVSMGRANAARC